jgi:5-methylcytosine-specific restriction endonuclease McrA
VDFRKAVLALNTAWYGCAECRKFFPDFEVEADHIIPRSAGGSDDPETNGQILCETCHQRKTTAEMKEAMEAEQVKQAMVRMYTVLYEKEHPPG